MPWHVEKRDGQFCVVKNVDGKRVACHGTRAEADAQVRALYANVPDAALARYGLSYDPDDPEMNADSTIVESDDIHPDVIEAWNVMLATWARERDVNIPVGPGHQLRDYWVRGPGALKIRWNTEGDGTRCIRHLRKYVKDPGGLCQEYHRMATGRSMHPHPGRPTEELRPEAFAEDWDVAAELYGCECPPVSEADDDDGDVDAAVTGVNLGSEDTVTARTRQPLHRIDPDAECPEGYHRSHNGTCVVDDNDDLESYALDGRLDELPSTPRVPQLRPGRPRDRDGCPPGYSRDDEGECAPDDAGEAELTGEGTVTADLDATGVDGDVGHWEGVLTVEGTESGDGRMFAANSLSWDEPPLPLMWQKETSHGGKSDVSVRVGSITRVWRDGGLIRGRGEVDLGCPDGAEAFRRMQRGFLDGNSVDVDSVKDADVELVYPESDGGTALGAEGADESGVMSGVFSKPQMTVYHRGRIRGSTLVEFPAFTEARLQIADPITAQANGDDGAARDHGESRDLTRFGAALQHATDASDAAWDRLTIVRRLPAVVGLDLARRVFAYVNPTRVTGDRVPLAAAQLPHHDLDEDDRPGPANLTGVAAAIAALHDARGDALLIPPAARREVYDHLAAHLRDAGREPPPFAAVSDRLEALTAATHTLTLVDCPPREWFDEPTDVELSGALTITDAGRVYGMLAPAGVRHRSFASRVVTLPMSRVDLTRFHGGETIVSDGGRVVTGAITMDCGHATTSYDITSIQAADHYDNACSVVATARVGLNDRGYWIAGALTPGVRSDQVARMMACRLSLDLRPHLDRPGWRELTAALLVPVPGFPMARTSPSVAVSDGQLVASTVPVNFTRSVDSPDDVIVYMETDDGADDVNDDVDSDKTDETDESFRFDPSQRRASDGRWTDVGGGGGGGGIGKKIRELAERAGRQAVETVAAAAIVAKLDQTKGKSVHVRSTQGHNFHGKSLGYATKDGVPSLKMRVPKGKIHVPIMFIRSIDDADTNESLWRMRAASGEGSMLTMNGDGDARRRLALRIARTIGRDRTSRVTQLRARVTAFRNVSTDERERLADTGHALPDGSYPIANVSDLQNAIRAYGRAGEADRARVRQHIVRRARALSREDLIPDDWQRASGASK